MRLERLNKSQVEEIYKTKMQEDFPADEIKPLKAILKGIDKGIYEPCGLFEDSELIGYAFFVKLGSDYLLDYLAVHSDMRNKGVGSTAVMLIANNLKDADNVIVEVEDPDYAEAASEKDLQTRRYNFLPEEWLHGYRTQSKMFWSALQNFEDGTAAEGGS